VGDRSALDFVVIGWQDGGGVHIVAASRDLLHAELQAEIAWQSPELLAGLTSDFDRVRPAGVMRFGAVGQGWVMAAGASYQEALWRCLRGWDPDGGTGQPWALRRTRIDHELTEGP